MSSYSIDVSVITAQDTSHKNITSNKIVLIDDTYTHSSNNMYLLTYYPEHNSSLIKNITIFTISNPNDYN